MAEAAETNPFRGVNVGEAADQIAELDLDAIEGERHRRPPPEAGDEITDDDQPLEESSETEDSAETEEEEVETEDSAEAETDEAAVDESDETEEEPEFIRNLNEWADAAEIPLEDLLQLETTVKVDGQESTVTLREALDGYQRQADYTQSKQRLKEERTQFEASASETAQLYERNNQVMASLMQELAQNYIGSANDADMERLRVEDPNEWAARQIEVQQRQQAFQRLLTTAAQQYDQWQSQYQNQMQGAIEKLKSEQVETLKAHVPNWGPDVEKSLHDFVGKTYGFTPEEAAATIDARTLRMALDAQRYHESKVKETLGKKRLRHVPKMQKPGGKPAQRSEAQLRADKVRSAKAKLQSSGKLGDAAAAIEQSLKDL